MKAFFSFLKLRDWIPAQEKWKVFLTVSTLGQPLPTHELHWTEKFPFPTRKPVAASHNAKADPFFKAILETASIKRLSLPNLLWHCPSSRLADPGCHKLEAFPSRGKSSSGAALFPICLRYNCSTLLATLSAPHDPVLASTTSHVLYHAQQGDKSTVSAC